MMSNRALAFLVAVPVAGMIGFGAGQATATLGPMAEARSPKGNAFVRVDKRFSLGPPNQRVMLGVDGEETEVLAVREEGSSAGEVMWSPDGSLAGALINGSRLAVIDPKARRVIYELRLVERTDGERHARGIGFSANAMAITFDDCPRAGAGCRPRFMALPTRQ
ncbi:MAG: hypothetical protein M3R55_09730 [Acidobacteriota bacterium]|nr:hypothetical protein [Acidobacteriota bacterium]